jgi:hypothetical protein
MMLDDFRMRIKECVDIEALRNIAMLLVKLIPNECKGAGYIVVSEDDDPPRVMFTGSREQAVAYKLGSEEAANYNLVVCVDSENFMIIIPEDRFGESAECFCPQYYNKI